MFTTKNRKYQSALINVFNAPTSGRSLLLLLCLSLLVGCESIDEMSLDAEQRAAANEQRHIARMEREREAVQLRMAQDLSLCQGMGFSPGGSDSAADTKIGACMQDLAHSEIQSQPLELLEERFAAYGQNLSLYEYQCREFIRHGLSKSQASCILDLELAVRSGVAEQQRYAELVDELAREIDHDNGSPIVDYYIFKKLFDD